MADDVNKPQVRRFPWGSPSGKALGPAGMTADELKISQGYRPQQAEEKIEQRIDTQPIAQTGPLEFISPSTSSEILRLAVPLAANPYATPTGPRHDHMMIRKALLRMHSEISKSLTHVLKHPPSSLTAEEADRMRASAQRESAMLLLLKPMLEWQEMIYAKVIGQQQA